MLQSIWSLAQLAIVVRALVDIWATLLSGRGVTRLRIFEAIKNLTNATKPVTENPVRVLFAAALGELDRYLLKINTDETKN